jgi:hypothetical protein
MCRASRKRGWLAIGNDRGRGKRASRLGEWKHGGKSEKLGSIYRREARKSVLKGEGRRCGQKTQKRLKVLKEMLKMATVLKQILKSWPPASLDLRQPSPSRFVIGFCRSPQFLRECPATLFGIAKSTKALNLSSI